MSKDIKDMTPEELEELRKTVKGKARWWLWGDKSARTKLLADHYRGSTGNASGRKSKIPEGTSSVRGNPNVPLLHLPNPRTLTEKADLSASPVLPTEDMDMSGPRAEVDSYIGPCYDCLYECSRLLSTGDSSRADKILESCRHNLVASPSPVNPDMNLTSVVETRLQFLTSGMLGGF